MKQDVEGVPYIVIGNKSWSGFSKDYENDILETIDKVYNTKKDERYDVLTYVKDLANGSKKDGKADTGSIIAIIVMILVAGGIGTGINFARKSTK